MACLYLELALIHQSTNEQLDCHNNRFNASIISKYDTPSTRYPFYLWNNPTLCPSKRLAHDQGAVSTRLRLAIRRRKKERKRQLQQRLKLFCFCVL
jgi:hypothetical protein